MKGKKGMGKSSNELPWSLNGESAVLGSLLIDPLGIEQVVGFLEPAHFYRESHRLIYQVMVDIYKNGGAIDVTTVTSVLKANNFLDQVGGTTYLAGLIAGVATPFHLVHYGKIVYEKAQRRGMMDIAQRLARIAADEKNTDFLSEALSLVDRLWQTDSEDGLFLADDLWSRYFDLMEDRLDHQRQVVNTGFLDLDRLVQGMWPGDYVIIGGLPSRGKTCLAEQIAEHAASIGLSVLMASLEMPVLEGLLVRRLSRWTKREFTALRQGEYLDEVLRVLPEKEQAHQVPRDKRNLHYLDCPGLNVMRLRGYARKVKLLKGLDLIIVDYLQLMTDGDRKGWSRYQAISYASRMLKSLARELQVPLIVLSQLSRKASGSAPRRPVLSDLRESGQIEQDADLVLFLHTEEGWETEGGCITEVIVAKHRNGPTGRIKLLFWQDGVQFLDLKEE